MLHTPAAPLSPKATPLAPGQTPLRQPPSHTTQRTRSPMCHTRCFDSSSWLGEATSGCRVTPEEMLLRRLVTATTLNARRIRRRAMYPASWLRVCGRSRAEMDVADSHLVVQRAFAWRREYCSECRQ